MKAAIMQPTYMPWIGYFAMIDMVDVFVFYDDVQFEKSSWHHRNKIKREDNQLIWLTVPCFKEHLKTNINDIVIKSSMNWERKHWLNIYHAYCKTKFFSNYENEIFEIYNRKWKRLVDLNIEVIKTMSKLLKINQPKFIRSSEIVGLSGRKTDRVINVLEKIGASEYISTEGTKVYLEPETEKFKEKGIKLFWFDYKPCEYPQAGKQFISYLSAVDLLFNNGEKSLVYLRKGSENALTVVE